MVYTSLAGPKTPSFRQGLPESRSHGGQLAVEQMFVQQISSLQLHIPVDWIPAIPAGMTSFQHLMMAPA